MELNKIIQLKNKVDRQLTAIRLSVNVDEHQFMSDLLQKEIEKQEAFLEAFKKQSTSFKEPTPKYVPIEFEPIEFKDYKDLPFSKRVNDMMFSLHKHIDEDMADKENLVVYTEDDVTVLLQTLMSDLMSFL